VQNINSVSDIESIVDQWNPIEYGKTRNFEHGAVSRLSPFISRGIISTRWVYQRLLNRGWRVDQMIPLLQQLTWRDYFQRVGQFFPELDQIELKNKQLNTQSGIPLAFEKATTGIKALDRGILQLQKTGYIHNHMRMYLAMLACNVGKYHWKDVGRWMYYYLLDADFASNFISFQWVAGTSRDKQYFANQNNINHFCETDDVDTIIDLRMEDFPLEEIPLILKQTTELPTSGFHLQSMPIQLDHSLPTCLYSMYNLDPHWRIDQPYNRVLLLEPTYFERFPMSLQSIQWMIKWAEKIKGMQIFWGEWSEFETITHQLPVFKKEHPHLNHWIAKEDQRDWIFPDINQYFPSFFGYWKQVEKRLKHEKIKNQ
jgi:deoxyribodipyrimidine photo-lyase